MIKARLVRENEAKKVRLGELEKGVEEFVIVRVSLGSYCCCCGRLTKLVVFSSPDQNQTECTHDPSTNACSGCRRAKESCVGSTEKRRRNRCGQDLV